MEIPAIDALHELHHEHHVPQIHHQVTNNCNAKNTLPLEPYLQMFRTRDIQTLTADDLNQLISDFCGIKFIPTEVEILHHLRSKCGFIKPHVLLDYFIPTLEEGNCGMHPKHFPGIKEEGSYYFHKMVKAFSKGEKKRKGTEPKLGWRRSGPPITISEIGSKTISILYEGSKKNLHWVRHEYFLGNENPRVGDYVVWRVFYPTKKSAHPNLNHSSQPISNASGQPISNPSALPISNPDPYCPMASDDILDANYTSSSTHIGGEFDWPDILDANNTFSSAGGEFDWQSVLDANNTFSSTQTGELDFLDNINYDVINVISDLCRSLT